MSGQRFRLYDEIAQAVERLASQAIEASERRDLHALAATCRQAEEISRCVQGMVESLDERQLASKETLLAARRQLRQALASVRAGELRARRALGLLSNVRGDEMRKLPAAYSPSARGR